MSEAPPFQYSLRTLLIIMSISAVLLGMFVPVLKTLPAGVLVVMGLGLAIYVVVTLLLLFAVSFIGLSNAADPLSPRSLASFTNEMQAEALVEALGVEGIRAMTVGGFTSGFRAEAPGEIQVIVASQDLTRAKAIFDNLKAEVVDSSFFDDEAEEES